MALETIMLLVNIVSVMLALVGLIYVARLRDFEIREVESSVNAIMFGIFFLFIVLIINTITSLDTVFHDRLVKLLPEITTYVGYLTQITEIALAPLLAACFLIAVFLIRENA